MEEYRTSVEEVDVVEVDAENKQILFESSEEEELVILYETDDTQFYSIKNEGRSVTLKMKTTGVPTKQRGAIAFMCRFLRLTWEV